MSADPSSASELLTAAQLRHVDEVCDRFEAAWQRAGPADPGPQIKAYLENTDEREQRALLPELLAIDLFYRRHRGESPQPEDYQSLFPEHDEVFIVCFQPAANSPPLGATVDAVPHVTDTGPAPPSPQASALPARLGRY